MERQCLPLPTVPVQSAPSSPVQIPPCPATGLVEVLPVDDVELSFIPLQAAVSQLQSGALSVAPDPEAVSRLVKLGMPRFAPLEPRSASNASSSPHSKSSLSGRKARLSAGPPPAPTRTGHSFSLESDGFAESVDW